MSNEIKVKQSDIKCNGIINLGGFAEWHLDFDLPPTALPNAGDYKIEIKLDDIGKIKQIIFDFSK